MATDLYSRGGITVDGLSSTIRTMKALGDDPTAIREALKEAAQTLAEASRDTVPNRTGKLERTIRPASTVRGAFVYVGNNQTVKYANPIHWGWFRDRKSEQARKSSRGYINKNIKPNPFLAKAANLNRQEIFDNFTRIMEDELTRTIRRNNRGRRI